MASQNPGDIDPLVQLFILVIGAVASAVAWLVGQKNNSSAPASPPNGNLLTMEIETLRRDLERVLFAHREALDTRIEKQIDKGLADFKQEARDISDRLRNMEISVAEIRAGKKASRRQIHED